MLLLDKLNKNAIFQQLIEFIIKARLSSSSNLIDSKTGKNSKKSTENAIKVIDLINFLNLFEIIRLEFEFWSFAKDQVKKVKSEKENGTTLSLDHEESNWLESFMPVCEITERGCQHIIDVATTAALLDNCNSIKGKHIIESAECRLFDRDSWVRAINDNSIPKYNRQDGHKLEPWLNSVNIQ